MGNVISLDAARAARIPQPEPIKLTRTPELAFILAMIQELPRRTRHRVFFHVMTMAERCPDCDASKEAAEIARQLGECFGEDE